VTDSKPSKSARKREHLALQKLGEQLIALNETELASLSIDERLIRAVQAARSIKSHGALRRQKQLIGKLMKSVDVEPIRLGIRLLKTDEIENKKLFAAAERWRDQLFKDSKSAFQTFSEATGSSDEQLRKLLAELNVVQDERKEKSIRRQIFRRIHEILVKITK
jgi:ribosome-associated protein